MEGDDDGSADEAQFAYIFGMAVESNGSLLVTDYFANKIKRITFEGINYFSPLTFLTNQMMN